MPDTQPQDGRTASLRVRLTPEELIDLKVFCVEQGYTASELVRWLIEDYIAQTRKKRRR